MGIQITSGSTLQCSFGVAPSTLQVLPLRRVMAGAPAATIEDCIPMVNILPFGMCNSIANPTVAAATAAAFGVLTPMPCVPLTPAPWVPGSPTVQIGSLPALNSDSKLMCAWGGTIQIIAPAQFTTMTA